MKSSIISILKLAMVSLVLCAVTTVVAQDAPPAKNAQATQAHAVVNINTANQSVLESLPRIGPAIAKRIIEFRERHGEFKKVEELLNVQGIGPKVFEKLKDRVCL